MPTKIIQQFSEIFTEFLSSNCNSSLEREMFPSEQESAEVAPVFKKNDKKDESDYRPTRILSSISKIYKKCIQAQLN